MQISLYLCFLYKYALILLMIIFFCWRFKFKIIDPALINFSACANFWGCKDDDGICRMDAFGGNVLLLRLVELQNISIHRPDL